LDVRLIVLKKNAADFENLPQKESPVDFSITKPFKYQSSREDKIYLLFL